MTELRVERTISATPDRVWRAFTTAEELAAWFWPGTWATTGEIDLTVGGRYRLASPVSGVALTGEYVAIEAPSRLVQTWQWEGDPEETLVTITIEESPEGALLTIVHERFEGSEDRDNHLQGWHDCLDRLAPYLTQ